jgi:hypothetical protein
MEDISEEELKSLPFEIETLVEPPPQDEEWHEIAKMVYGAMLRDPARLWMGPAAWAIAYLMCESISREMKPQAIGIVEGGIDLETGEQLAGHVARETVPMKGATITSILKWTGLNGLHEAERLAISKVIKFNAVDQPTHQVDDEEVAESRDFFVVPGERETS